MPAIAIRSSGAANAGFHAFAPKAASICLAALSQALPLRNQTSIDVAGKSHSAGGGFLVAIGVDSTVARAAVLTLMATFAVDPGVTLIGEAGPLQAAAFGAPVQGTVTLKGAPVAASCNEKLAVCPALTVAALPPVGTVSVRLPEADPAVTVEVLLALAP